MIVNETKTKIMVFGTTVGHQFMYNDKQLEIVDQYKYLGVLFNTINRVNGNVFKNAQAHICIQAKKAMFKILKDTRKIGMLSPNVALKLFDSLVLPIMEYGNEVWFSNKEIGDLEKVHLKYLKIILGVNKSTCNLAVRGELARYPLIIRQKVQCIKYWSRILTSIDGSLVKCVYNILLDLHNGGFKNWVTNVHNILLDVGFTEEWNNQLCNKMSIVHLKKCLMNKYRSSWENDVKNIVANPKMRTYCEFKLTFSYESYLTHVRDFKLRKSLVQFRTSSHQLEIEKGRHSNIPSNLRACKVCNTGEVEDEHHLLMCCHKYNDIRFEFLCIRENIGLFHHNFCSILSCEKSSFYLAKCIDKMFNRRKEILKLL